MNIQEAIEKMKEQSWEYENRYFRYELVIDLEDAQEIVSQIKEPAKVVVPKFVAEWIEEKKKSGIDLHKSMTYEVKVDVFKYIMDNSETYARAWLDGYEVEQERLYTVEIPNTNDDSLTVLEFISDSCIVLTQMESFPDNWKEMDIYQLTESEIKQDFEWAWDAGFAEPVEVEEVK